VSVGPIETPGIAAAWARIREIQARTAPAAAGGSGGAGGFQAALAGARPTAAAAAPVRTAHELARSGVPGAGLGLTPPPLAGPAPAAGVAIGAGTPLGRRIAALAVAELGVSEEPPGSNDGRRIAEYRTATQGAGVGPWCAYFTSWVAAQAGVPVGDRGQGYGWVPDVSRWARETGRWVPADAGRPAVGDLVVFDRDGDGVHDHIGVVTGIRPDGGVETVEGNSDDRVSARSYQPGEAAGFVRLG
jgi:hypothetical protein